MGVREAPQCPITGADDVTVLAEITAERLVTLYRDDLKIDVAHVFAGVEELSLCHAAGSDLLFFDPPVMGDSAFYQELRRHAWYDPPEKQEYRLAAEAIAPGSEVLDVGSGPGAFAAYLGHARHVGLEPDAAAARLAKELGRDVRAERLEDHSGFYDAVCAFQVLEHLAEPSRFVNTALARLRPDGLLILGVPAFDSYLSALRSFVLDLPPHHVSWWSDRALMALARKFGLEVLGLEHPPVEPWESRLYWMARIQRGTPEPQDRLKGGRLERVASYLAAGLLDQVRTPPPDARGGTALLICRKPA